MMKIVLPSVASAPALPAPAIAARDGEFARSLDRVLRDAAGAKGRVEAEPADDLRPEDVDAQRDLGTEPDDGEAAMAAVEAPRPEGHEAPRAPRETHDTPDQTAAPAPSAGNAQTAETATSTDATAPPMSTARGAAASAAASAAPSATAQLANAPAALASQSPPASPVSVGAAPPASPVAEGTKPAPLPGTGVGTPPASPVADGAAPPASPMAQAPAAAQTAVADVAARANGAVKRPAADSAAATTDRSATADEAAANGGDGHGRDALELAGDETLHFGLRRALAASDGKAAPRPLIDGNATLVATQGTAEKPVAEGAAARPQLLPDAGVAAEAPQSSAGAASSGGDALPLPGSVGTSASHGASPTAAAAAHARSPVVIQSSLGDVAVHVARAAADGVDRIRIQLEPADMGRIDVKLEVGHDGRVIAVIAADRQDTLDLLQRDARALERALQEAGLKADSNSLDFNLRGGGQERQRAEGGEQPSRGGAPTLADERAQAVAAAAAAYRPLANGTLDLRV
jgi:flagellar hook-length control protein FliK